MSKFNVEQAVAVANIQQLINDWAKELDIENGRSIGTLVTEDCRYVLGGNPREGRAAIEAFYAERLTRLSAQPEGVPTHRHALSNLRVTFQDADNASITFNLIYFSTAGMSAGTNHADPASYADVRMDVRQEADAWRIAMFDSGQVFRRTIG